MPLSQKFLSSPLCCTKQGETGHTRLRFCALRDGKTGDSFLIEHWECWMQTLVREFEAIDLIRHGNGQGKPKITPVPAGAGLKRKPSIY